MQIGESSVNFGEDPEINPFLSNTAFAAEMVGAGSAWQIGKARNKARLSHAIHAKTDRRMKEVRQGGKRQFGFQEKFSEQGGVRSKKGYYSTKSRKNKAYRRLKDLSHAKRGMVAVTKMLGVASIMALSASVFESAFDGLTSYHSAQRSGRQAMGKSSNDAQYYDTRVAATMRQRALQVIHNSQLSTRAAFGQEASYMHR